LSHFYSASHHSGIDTETFPSCAVWTGPLIQDGRFYTSTGVSAGFNLSWAMISGSSIWSKAAAKSTLKGARARTRRVKGGNGLPRYWDGNCWATRTGAAGWSFLFAKWNGFILLNATTGPKTAHSAADFAHLGNGRKVRFV
jgi:hypothetical protein